MVFVFIKIEYAAIAKSCLVISIDYNRRVHTYQGCSFCAHSPRPQTNVETLDDSAGQNALQTPRIPSTTLSFASDEQPEKTYEAIASSPPPYEISRRGSRRSSASKARSRLSRFLLGRRSDVKQPTETTSLESAAAAAHLGLPPVSPVSSVEAEAVSSVESEPSSPAELESLRPHAELPAETYQ